MSSHCEVVIPSVARDPSTAQISSAVPSFSTLPRSQRSGAPASADDCGNTSRASMARLAALFLDCSNPMSARSNRQISARSSQPPLPQPPTPWPRTRGNLTVEVYSGPQHTPPEFQAIPHPKLQRRNRSRMHGQQLFKHLRRLRQSPKNPSPHPRMIVHEQHQFAHVARQSADLSCFCWYPPRSPEHIASASAVACWNARLRPSPVIASAEPDAVSQQRHTPAGHGLQSCGSP